MGRKMSLFDSGVRPAIDQYLLDEAAKVRNYGDYWSASSAGYCMRKNIFERLQVPFVSEDARKQRVFSSGHIFHEWIQGITKGAGLSVAQELELQDETFMIRGHIDDLVLISTTADDDGGFSKDCHLILYDYKTAHSRSFTYSKARPEMGHYHRYQLGTYLMMLRNFKSDAPKNSLRDKYNINELSEARRLSISKDDLRMDEKQLLWSPELETEITAYWTALNRYWTDKKLPPCTCHEYDGGFMASDKYNPYYYNDEPCSLDWYAKFKKEEHGNAVAVR